MKVNDLVEVVGDGLRGFIKSISENGTDVIIRYNNNIDDIYNTTISTLRKKQSYKQFKKHDPVLYTVDSVHYIIYKIYGNDSDYPFLCDLAYWDVHSHRYEFKTAIDTRLLLYAQKSYMFNQIKVKVISSEISGRLLGGRSRKSSFVNSVLSIMAVHSYNKNEFSESDYNLKDVKSIYSLGSSNGHSYTFFDIETEPIIKNLKSKVRKEISVGSRVKCINDKKTTRVKYGKKYFVKKIITNKIDKNLDVLVLSEMENQTIVNNYRKRFRII